MEVKLWSHCRYYYLWAYLWMYVSGKLKKKKIFFFFFLLMFLDTELQKKGAFGCVSEVAPNPFYCYCGVIVASFVYLKIARALTTL